jgi:hypothetical protein
MLITYSGNVLPVEMSFLESRTDSSATGFIDTGNKLKYGPSAPTVTTVPIYPI